MAQSGFPQLTRGDWIGFWAPAGTSPDIVNRLNREVNAGLTTPETKAAMKKLGFEPSGGSPQEFAAFIREEIEVWTPAAKAAGILPKCALSRMNRLSVKIATWNHDRVRALPARGLEAQCCWKVKWLA